MSRSVSGYRKWEQDKRSISDPTAVHLRIIENEPDVVRQLLRSNG